MTLKCSKSVDYLGPEKLYDLKFSPSHDPFYFMLASFLLNKKIHVIFWHYVLLGNRYTSKYIVIKFNTFNIIYCK